MKPARWIEVSVWAVGFILLICYAALRVLAEWDRRAGVKAFQTLRLVALAHESGNLGEPSGHADQSLWSEARVRAFRRTMLDEAPEGVLLVPALRLVVPIYAGTTPSELNRGVGHVGGTAPLDSMGNAAIAGHRDGFFRSLGHIKLGQMLYIETVNGTRRYRVFDTRIVARSDVSVLARTAVPSVTLITCYPFYFVGPAPRRFIVRAQLFPSRRRAAEFRAAEDAQRQE